MHILLTGATGYIGKRLLPVLLEAGHAVTCCVRDSRRFHLPESGGERVRVIETDFTRKPDYPEDLPAVDAAYYLIHSLSLSQGGYASHEKLTATNFSWLAEELGCRQVIYLGGIANEEDLSEHLSSRKAVEDVLKEGNYAYTILRAGIIVGSGSASFEIIRDLVEKLPLMLAPRWVNTRCQPIAVKNVIQYLTGVLDNRETFNQTFDIGGPEVMTYRQMMLDFAEVRKLKRYIYTMPVMTPRLSSYWLYFVTATNYNLAVNLVKSMKVEVVCHDERLQDILQINLIPYKEAVRRAFGSMEQNMVISSWIDANNSGRIKEELSAYIGVPQHGCLVDRTVRTLEGSPEEVWKRILSIGGETGWYYANWLWKLRGFMDKLVGGVGLRRGRRDQYEIKTGEALDFWRVLLVDEQRKRLLLLAEMKLPGEAWLEFRIDDQGERPVLVQTATFRPWGIHGRHYWYIISPFHLFVFTGMAKSLVKKGSAVQETELLKSA